MQNLVEFSYQSTGTSVKWDECGMREMQQRAFSARSNQYILLMSPPASGKSRANMFLALDKMHHQGLKKTIVCVPETSIGGSFSDTDLMAHGFFADWKVETQYDLCSDEGTDGSKVKKFIEFMSSEAEVLVCSHSTLRNAFPQLQPEDFNECFLAIDEFHHVSSKDSNVLGAQLQRLMDESDCHILAMTGSYFRGDAEDILSPEYEARFKKVTYNYYEQLKGYKYLKTLGIGYDFYQGTYLDSIRELLHPEKKTIIHIPNVNSKESTGDKHGEVLAIINKVGHIKSIDSATQMITVQLHEPDARGRKEIRVADLVNEDRKRLQSYLRKVEHVDDVDWIIALGTAKEGFDWSFCEYALTVGVRRSTTEIIQIIGRCTRDSSNKSHAQWVNLMVDPLHAPEETAAEVNDMLKVITCCLLMEDVFESSFNFQTAKVNIEEPKSGANLDDPEDGVVSIIIDKGPKPSLPLKGLPEVKTDRAKSIIDEHMSDIINELYQRKETKKMQFDKIDADYYNTSFIPSVIAEKFPDLDEDEITVVSEYTLVNLAIKPLKSERGEIDRKYVSIAGRKFKVADLDINLIKPLNLFEGRSVFEVMSKDINKDMLYQIKNLVAGVNVSMSADEFKHVIQKAAMWINTKGTRPSLNSECEKEVRMAEAIAFAESKRGRAHALN